MRAVNLLPPDSYAPKQRLPHAPIVLAGVVPFLAGALVFLGWSLEHAKVVDRQNELGAVQASIAALRPSQTQRDEATRLTAERAPRLTAFQDVLAKRLSWDVALDQITRVLPDDVWLKTLTAQSPTPATVSTTSPVSTPNAFTIDGFAFSQDSVARVLERLALVPSLSDVALVSTSSSSVGQHPIVEFQVTAGVNAPAAPATPAVVTR